MQWVPHENNQWKQCNLKFPRKQQDSVSYRHHKDKETLGVLYKGACQKQVQSINFIKNTRATSRLG